MHPIPPKCRNTLLPPAASATYYLIMNDQRNNPPATVEISHAIQEQQAVLSNLYQLYIHDFTEFVGLPLGNDGRFDYDPLPPYWIEPDRFPFIVWVDGKLAGFALVKKGSDFSGRAEVWDMADFFVVRGVRGKGVGCSVAKSIWQQFPGPWEVRVITTNVPAQQFWTKAISRFLGKRIEPELVTKGEETRYLFLFESEVNHVLPQSSSPV
jgi:predicted acetyltransferase